VVGHATTDAFGSVLDLLAEEYVVEYFYLSADGIYALTRLSNSAVERSNLSEKEPDGLAGVAVMKRF